MNNFFKNAMVWIVIGIVMLTLFQSFSPNSIRQKTIDYSSFLELVKTGNISEVVFENDLIRVKRINGEKFLTYNPETDNTALIGELNKSGKPFFSLVFTSSNHDPFDIPESKGGTLDIKNLKPICARCNLSMSDNYTIQEWIKLSKDKKRCYCFGYN